jgi:hypothetical protein
VVFLALNRGEPGDLYATIILALVPWALTAAPFGIRWAYRGFKAG